MNYHCNILGFGIERLQFFFRAVFLLPIIVTNIKLNIIEFIWNWFTVLRYWMLKFYLERKITTWGVFSEHSGPVLWAHSDFCSLQWCYVVFIISSLMSFKKIMMLGKCFTRFCWSCYDVNGINKRFLEIIHLDPLNSLQDMKHNGSPDTKLHPDKSIQLKGATAFFFPCCFVLNKLPCIWWIDFFGFWVA